MLTPDSPVDKIQGIGPQFAARLKKLHIESVSSLIDHLPSRYLDLTTVTTISELSVKKPACLKVNLDKPHQFYTRQGRLITTARAEDDTGQINLTWFNSPYIKNLLHPGVEYFVAGTPSLFSGKITIISPQLEPFSQNPLHTKGLIPIYPQTEGVSSKWLRSRIKFALTEVKFTDNLPQDLIRQIDLPDLQTAYRSIHFPKDKLSALTADQRLTFNFHLHLNLVNLLELESLGNSLKLKIDSKLHRQFFKNLPFKLTSGQEKAIAAVFSDLSLPSPTHRLIQGDTGSGKTVIAISSAIQTLANHFSFCLMAPTEILANQHYHTFKKLSSSKLNLQLVTAESPLNQNSFDKPTIFIGTHALLNQLPHSLPYPLATVFIDEQHKFGVNQRKFLTNRQPVPHLFDLTATPIPRTVALGLFGEVAISTISSKPKTQKPTKTWLLPTKRFVSGFGWLKKHLNNHQKIFVVCPLIDESESLKQLASVKKLFQFYQQKFSDVAAVYLIHGRLSPIQKQEVLSDFNKSKSAILVSTPIIEVGIDIPKANIIIIHSAERFGLSQLHQLRGRVGRGECQGYCLLVPSVDNQIEIDRLQFLT
ncbi:DEAD/DEAH box helicase family protein, partial [Candidatus Collierbacteria bacterium]|nr:DEAD/DEAH box helicase family protein [Candidatus Collierbacteria bacterium]